MTASEEAPAPNAAAPAPTGLVAKSLHGAKWTYLATMLSAILQVLFAAVMGRLLFPEIFGIIAITQLVLNFAAYFARMGVGQALIQKLELTTEDIRAGFTSSVVLGGLTTAVVWFSAPLITTLFRESDDVTAVLRVMAFILLISALGQTAMSLMDRALRFRETALIEMVAYVVGYFAVGIGLAMAGAGVWSLVAAALGQQLLKTVLLYERTRHTLVPIFYRTAYRPLLAFGSRVSVISIMEYIGISLDTFMVGRYAGTAALGQYNRGNMLIQVPLYRLSDALGQVLFPSFSKIQNDVNRTRRAYLSAVGLSAGVLLPLCAGIAVASNEIVLVVLGGQWTPVIPILPILSVYGSFLVLTHFAGLVAEAKGELNKKIVLQGCYVLMLPLLLLPALGRGLWAYATAFVLGNLFLHVGYMFLMRAILGVQMRDYGRIYGRSVAAALITGVSIAAVRLPLVAVDAVLPVVLVCEMAVGAVALVGLFRVGPLRPIGLEIVDRLDGQDAGMIGRIAGLMVGRQPPAEDADPPHTAR